MQSPPITQAEIEARISNHLDELLELWQAEQGSSKPRDLELMASVIPFPRGGAVRVLDLCCGPGDVGRAIRRIYLKAQIDCIDRDPFLTAICKGINGRDGTSGRIIVRDLKDEAWPDELSGSYDIVAVVNALHWFETARAEQLLAEVHEALGSGGVFLLAEPACPEKPFAAGFAEWKARQPQRYLQENWVHFWSRANDILEYDHVSLLGPRNDNRIGDSMTAAGWTRLIEAAGFKLTDALLRDADQVIIAAQKLQ
jgi:SAM-dependent methyltransferase